MTSRACPRTPDLVIVAGERPVAVEVELTPKSPGRLQGILRGWRRCAVASRGRRLGLDLGRPQGIARATHINPPSHSLLSLAVTAVGIAWRKSRRASAHAAGGTPANPAAG